MLNRERVEYCTCAQHRNSNIAVVFTSIRRENEEHAWPKEIRMGDLISFMPCSILSVSQSVTYTNKYKNRITNIIQVLNILHVSTALCHPQVVSNIKHYKHLLPHQSFREKCQMLMCI